MVQSLFIHFCLSFPTLSLQIWHCKSTKGDVQMKELHPDHPHLRKRLTSLTLPLSCCGEKSLQEKKDKEKVYCFYVCLYCMEKQCIVTIQQLVIKYMHVNFNICTLKRYSIILFNHKYIHITIFNTVFLQYNIILYIYILYNQFDNYILYIQSKFIKYTAITIHLIYIQQFTVMSKWDLPHADLPQLVRGTASKAFAAYSQSVPPKIALQLEKSPDMFPNLKTT